MNRFGGTTIPRRLYDFFLNKWYVSSLIFAFPAIYCILFPSGPNEVYRPFFLILFGGSTIFGLVKSLGDKYNDSAKAKGQIILRRLLGSFDEEVRNETASLLSSLRKIDQNRRGIDLFEVVRPREQIESLLCSMQDVFGGIFGIPREDVGLSIVFLRSYRQKWDWIRTESVEDDLSLDSLVGNQQTTARQVIDKKYRSLFFPDKRIAQQLKMYVPGAKDNPKSETIGSVMCSDISIGSSRYSITAVLSVTTYGVQLCETNDDEAIDKIVRIILPPFENRIKNHLSVITLKELTLPKKHTLRRKSL